MSAAVEVRRVSDEIVSATAGAVEVEVGATVPMRAWHDERVWLKVDRFEDSSLGPAAVGKAYDAEPYETREGVTFNAPERFVGFMALPLERVVQPRAKRRATGGRGVCGVVGCESVCVGVRDRTALELYPTLEVDARDDGTVRVCAKHRRMADAGE